MLLKLRGDTSYFPALASLSPKQPPKPYIRGMEAVWGIILGAGLLCLYFLPAYIGRKKRNGTAIGLLNLFLGWTIIGWIGALVWATTKD